MSDRVYEGAHNTFNVHIRVCRPSPWVVYPIMVRMSFSKPLSSIRSASSNTRYVTLHGVSWTNYTRETKNARTHPLRSRAPSFTRSIIRPGVPTTILALLFLRALICAPLSRPPNTATLSIPCGFPTSKRVSCVWIASSRVGDMTRTLIPLDFGVLMRREMAGMPNASVFPLRTGHSQSWAGEDRDIVIPAGLGDTNYILTL